MPFWLRLSGIPLICAVVGVLVGLISYPKIENGAIFFTLGFAWVFLTGRARRTYWTARLRTRATMDERRAQSARG